MVDVVAAGVVIHYVTERPVRRDKGTLTILIHCEIEVVIDRIERRFKMLYRLPSSQSSSTAKDVKIADTMVLVRTEIEYVMGFVVKRGDFFSFRIDDGTEIHWFLEMTVFTNRVPNIGFSISARLVRNKVKNLIIRQLNQTGLHRGTVLLVYYRRQPLRLLPIIAMLFRLPQITVQVTVSHAYTACQNHSSAVFAQAEVAVEVFGMVDGRRQRLR